MLVAEFGNTYCMVTVRGMLVSPGAAAVGLAVVPHETLIILKPVVVVLANVGANSTVAARNRTSSENASIFDFKLIYLVLIHRFSENPVWLIALVPFFKRDSEAYIGVRYIYRI